MNTSNPLLTGLLGLLIAGAAAYLLTDTNIKKEFNQSGQYSCRRVLSDKIYTFNTKDDSTVLTFGVHVPFAPYSSISFKDKDSDKIMKLESIEGKLFDAQENEYICKHVPD